MATRHPSRPGLPTPPTSTHGHSAPDRPKLRNSCHACASSKLKCSQDKPTCSRCAKRGLTCEYVAAKQGGRKPRSRSGSANNRPNEVSSTAITANETVHLTSQPNWSAAPSSSNPSTDALRSSPGSMHQSPKTSISGSSDILQDLFGPMDQTMSSSSTVGSRDTGTDLDDYFTSPISFSTEMSDVDIFGMADFFPAGIDSSSNTGSESLSDAFPVFEDAVSELFALSTPSSLPRHPTPPSRDVHNFQGIRAPEPPCSCLVQALGFMKQLFPSPSNACMTFATQGLDKASAIPTIQAVVAQNETTIEAVSTMLKCSCSQDGYLLAVMSLIIFKVLGWYATVARKTAGLHGAASQASRSRQSSPFEHILQQNPNTTTTIGSYCLEGADSPRMAAQLVLSELHRVRRLVDQLSSKLKVQAAKKGRGGAETPESMDLENDMALPLSAVMYEQLDNDLRRRLKALSYEMIDRLRRL